MRHPVPIIDVTSLTILDNAIALIVGHLLKNAPKPTRLRLSYEIINLVFYSAFLLVGAATMVSAGQDVFAGYFILAPPIVVSPVSP